MLDRAPEPGGGQGGGSLNGECWSRLEAQGMGSLAGEVVFAPTNASSLWCGTR